MTRRPSSIHLDEPIARLWPARCSAGGQGPLGHTGVVALMVSGQHYLVDKGAPEEDDDSYTACHRIGSSRVATLSREQAHGGERWWQPTAEPTTPRGRLTLRQLLRACGCGYDPALDNCWNGVERMLARAKVEEDDQFEEPFPWQAKLALGVGAAIGTLAAIGAAIIGGSRR